MSNSLLTPVKIVAETLRIAFNNSAFLGNVDDGYESEYKGTPKPGQSITYRRPVQFRVRNGAVANVQDVNETGGTMTVQPEVGIDFEFSDFDLTLTIEKFSERYLQPAGSRLATELDFQIGQRFYEVFNFVGTPGTKPANLTPILDAGALLDECACPRDQRYMALGPRSNAAVVGGLSGTFNDQKTVSEQNKTGLVKTNVGFDFLMSQNLPTHTVGGLGGTPLVNGANQGIINAGSTDNPYAETTTLATDAWTAAAANRLNRGDVITIAGVSAVNPETKQSTGQLKQFVVTANTSSDAAGLANVVISPAIIAGGAYQNVTARPADNAAITVLTGAANTGYQQNLGWHKSALSMVSIPMELPKGMDMAAQVSYRGVRLRFLRGFDIINNKRISRFDLLYAAKWNRPDWGVRLTA